MQKLLFDGSSSAVACAIASIIWFPQNLDVSPTSHSPDLRSPSSLTDVFGMGVQSMRRGPSKMQSFGDRRSKRIGHVMQTQTSDCADPDGKSLDFGVTNPQSKLRLSSQTQYPQLDMTTQVALSTALQILNRDRNNRMQAINEMTNQRCRSCPEPGQLVEVRRRQWIVANVVTSTQSGIAIPQNAVTLSSIDEDGLGEELEVIWEIEPGAQIIERAGLPLITGQDDSSTLEAFLDAVRWGAATNADRGFLQAPFRSGVSIEDFQLDPLVRAIDMARVNLLIADDVGLGKTIEAGLVIQEMLLRHRARTVLISARLHSRKNGVSRCSKNLASNSA
jgi:hypothetical protein